MTARDRCGCAAGSSPLTAVFGVAVFLAFLMLASQVLVHAYTSSVVSAVAFDAARRAAAEGETCASVDVRAHVVEALGGYGQRIEPPVCERDGPLTVVTVAGPTPARLVDAFGAGLGLDRVERTARVRTEGVEPGPLAP